MQGLVVASGDFHSVDCSSLKFPRILKWRLDAWNFSSCIVYRNATHFSPDSTNQMMGFGYLANPADEKGLRNT